MFISFLLFSILLNLIHSTNSADEVKNSHTKPWWANAVIYQVYPISFKDSTGEGYGDIRGITQKLPYLKELGVQGVWVQPFYKSPKHDTGYDIQSFTSIDPSYGDTDDFDELLDVCEELGMHLMIDFVPNHTSHMHPWFRKSIAREAPYDNFYIWKKPKGFDKNGQPISPNNWVDRTATGSAWKWEPRREEFYLHQFLEAQPDLNYRNPAVVEAMTNLLKYWIERGVDGFRVDAVNYLYEDESFRDESILDHSKKVEELEWQDYTKTYSLNHPDTRKLLNYWAEVVGSYVQKDNKKRVLVLEGYAELDEVVQYYGGPQVGNDPRLMIPMNFQLQTPVNQSCNAEHFKALIDGWLLRMNKNDVANWVLGNHDNTRVASKMGPSFADAMNMLSMTLPGISLVYNGEEIGMEDTFLRYDQCKDKFALKLGPKKYMTMGRDFYRTPMQWDNSVSSGFTTNIQPWLPVNPNYRWKNVKTQNENRRSHLNVFKAMANLKSTKVTFRDGMTQTLSIDKYILGVIRYLRGHDTYILLINTDLFVRDTYLTKFASQHLQRSVEVAVASINSNYVEGVMIDGPDYKVTLTPRSAVLLRLNGSVARDQHRRIKSKL